MCRRLGEVCTVVGEASPRYTSISISAGSPAHPSYAQRRRLAGYHVGSDRNEHIASLLTRAPPQQAALARALHH